MAIMQYNSGVVENINPRQVVFTDEELLGYFEENQKLRSRRLSDIPNAWCIWGEDETSAENNFNRLGSRIVGESVYTPILIIHDSELNPDLYLTEKIIHSNYEDFRTTVIGYFDVIAMEILDEMDYHQSEEGFAGSEFPPKLMIIGPTEDKRVLMEFDPELQGPEFWEFDNFSIFASRGFGYLHQFFNKNTNVLGNSFAIYADNKSIIFIRDENVEFVMEKVLENFEVREKYHGCSHIVAMLKKWAEYIKGGKEPMDDKWEDYTRKLEENG